MNQKAKKWGITCLSIIAAMFVLSLLQRYAFKYMARDTTLPILVILFIAYSISCVAFFYSIIEGDPFKKNLLKWLVSNVIFLLITSILAFVTVVLMGVFDEPFLFVVPIAALSALGVLIISMLLVFLLKMRQGRSR